MKKVFVNTNIILDWLLDREPFSSPALRLFILAEQQGVLLGTSSVSVINAAYILRKSIGPKLVLDSINALLALCRVVDDGEEQVRQALNARAPDFEDAFQFYCALSWHADVIASRDKNGFKLSTISVMTAEEIVLAIRDNAL